MSIPLLLPGELEQRVDLVAAEAVAAGRIDAIAVPRDQRDPLCEGDRQVGADASEAAVGQAMAREVVDPRVVGQELELDAILTGPERKPAGEVHQPEATREDLVNVVAVQQIGKFGAQAEATAQAERRKGVSVLSDARLQERARLCAPERVDPAQAYPGLLREVLGLLRLLRQAVATGRCAVAELVPQRQFCGKCGGEVRRHAAQAHARAHPVERGVRGQAEAVRRVVATVVEDVHRAHTDLGLERQDAGDLRATQVVGQRRFGRVARERLLFIETAVRFPELGMAGGEEPAAEPAAEGAVGGWPVIAYHLPGRIDWGDERAQVEVLI